MLPFLHRWEYYWKSEFDTDAKIGNYYHHGGEQLGFYKNVHNVHIKKDVIMLL